MLGKRLRRARKARKMNQAALANASGVGQGHISRLESGDLKDVQGETLAKLALALAVTTDYLLGLEERRQAAAAPADPPKTRRRARVGA